ncbi:MAG: ABC transporter ATP-binding protein [Actinobacteria bacterium 13_2_20CM_2_71_6]|nr:MAG: ABC transporter ATP-binding protein [Actinobacteria bacterium 13_2_20CM_2_71_6]
MGMKETVPAIEIRALRRYYGPVRAVNGVDLTVRRGEVVALLGPNGAGKTTTLDTLLGLSTPDSGTVAVFGRPPKAAIGAGQVGAVLQDGALMPGAKVGELIRAMAALQPKPARLTDVASAAGVEGILDRRVEKLSGGQAQRVRFAIALVGDPELLVLDEPTAGLDTAARRAFWTSVRGYAAAGRTVLFSTHYLEEADEVADRIVLIASGKVVADGPTTEIRAMAAARLVRATLSEADAEELRALPGVTDVEVHGTAIALRSADSDATVRALLYAYPLIRDVQVAAAPLADAVLALTDEGTD